MRFMGNSDKKQKLARWLTDKFLAWQTEQGEPKDWRDFAAYLDVGEGALGTWRNMRSLPDLGGIIQIAKRYPDIWEIMGMSPPQNGAIRNGDPFMPPELGISALEKLRLLISWMKELTEEERLTVLDEALRRKPRGKRVPPVNAERGKRA